MFKSAKGTKIVKRKKNCAAGEKKELSCLGNGVKNVLKHQFTSAARPYCDCKTVLKMSMFLAYFLRFS